MSPILENLDFAMVDVWLIVKSVSLAVDFLSSERGMPEGCSGRILKGDPRRDACRMKTVLSLKLGRQCFLIVYVDF